MMKKPLILCLATLTLIHLSCTKEVTELPPATQEGLNTFGCKVDGKFWVPQGFGSFPANDILDAHFASGDLYINARNFSSSPTETEFEIFIKGASVEGVYLLNTTTSYSSTAASYGYYVHRQINPDNEWITSTQYTGSVTITRIDMVNHFVSGTFTFQAINLYNAPAPISVTEGRFDVKTQ
ncbi:MAG TPA: hypothetical protein VLJ68_00870 [Chitinophagaceae bacterium]|nr:hypothetical protein [Chitinophagaceae bacterium]